MTYIIAEPCVDVLDKACIEECPVDCIYEGNRMLYIHPDECVDCGACEPVCPVEAIFYEDDVPEQWKDYTSANYEFFEDLGSPGGASKVGKIDKDAPFVAAQPPQGRPSTDPAPRRCGGRAARLPLGPARAGQGRRAAAHPDGIVDLSIGTPVDPVPAVIREALAAAADAPGYPLTAGTPALRAAIGGLAAPGAAAPAGRRLGGAADDRLQGAGRAGCRRCCGIGPGDMVVHPGGLLPDLRGRGAAGRRRRVVRADSLTALGPAPGSGWSGSTRRPTRPAGCCPPTHLRKVVDWARERGAVVASDECYLRLRLGGRAGLGAAPVGVAAATTPGVLAVHSLSKRSNLAGYRAGFVAGDPALVAELLEVRKHAGHDRAGAGAGRDGRRARRRRARRRAAGAVRGPAGRAARRRWSRPASPIEHSEAGLYLWATRGEDCWADGRLAGRARHPGRAGRLLRPGRRAARAGRADRDRRAGRRRSGAAGA